MQSQQKLQNVWEVQSTVISSKSCTLLYPTRRPSHPSHPIQSTYSFVSDIVLIPLKYGRLPITLHIVLSQVSDSLRNIHRVLVESGPSFSKNILDLVISSTKCSVSSISEIRALYETLFVQGTLLTMRYMVFKKFPESSVKGELESIKEMFIASNFRFKMLIIISKFKKSVS